MKISFIAVCLANRKICTNPTVPQIRGLWEFLWKSIPNSKWKLLFLARSENLPTGLYILTSLMSFFNYRSEPNYLRIYWIDFYDFFSSNDRYLFVDDRSFSDSSRDVATATNFGRNSQNDLHSAFWHSEADRNMAVQIVDQIWLQSFKFNRLI